MGERLHINLFFGDKLIEIIKGATFDSENKEELDRAHAIAYAKVPLAPGFHTEVYNEKGERVSDKFYDPGNGINGG